MSVFINHPIYVGYLSSKYGTKALQTPPFKPLTSLFGPHPTVLQYHMALLGDSDTICNDLEKVLATSVL
jgi:hypothetical protein